MTSAKNPALLMLERALKPQQGGGRVGEEATFSISLDEEVLWRGSSSRMQEMFAKLAGQLLRGQAYLDFLAGVEVGLGARAKTGLWGRLVLNNADGTSEDCVLLAPAPQRLRLAVEPVEGAYRFGWVQADGAFVRERSVTAEDVRRSGYADLKHLLVFEAKSGMCACARMLRVAQHEVLYSGREGAVLYDVSLPVPRALMPVDDPVTDWRARELQFFRAHEATFPSAFSRTSIENPAQCLDSSGAPWLVCGVTDGMYLVTNGHEERQCFLDELFSLYSFPLLRTSAINLVQTWQTSPVADTGAQEQDREENWGESFGTFR